MDELSMNISAMKTLSAFLAFLFLTGAAQAADAIVLPAPQTEGGIGLFEALKKRQSALGGDFSLAPVDRQALSTILWAASGLNRGDTGWVVPMAEGLPPYVRIYVASAEGAWRYEWSGHKLEPVAEGNAVNRLGGPGFSRKASCVLVFVADAKALKGLKNQSSAQDFAQVLTGAMTQDVYLAAAALKLGARYIHSMSASSVAELLRLDPEDKPVALMLLGN
jgi:nitroreductase